ncbi:uncharacterized protein LOC124119024 isoform X1 [Haliotis rufescens]|uniref:uncharacterized protein LOC124119024 isoform X1 n=1 Tax=Haliotis rufescens TaxID=6454 RepID=UPI00201E9BB0|nr:uncharacterized protein LOC124119024 isoform X1 [Haliotis rufescens]
MTVKHNQVLILLVLTLSFINDSASTCPGGVALFGREYTIVGDRSKYTRFLWVRPTDGWYVATCNPSCSPVAGYRATMNATHSTLTIHSVGVADAGTWSIRDANDASAKPVDVCQLNATNSTCPGGVGLLGTEYTIVGDRSNYTGFKWVRPTDGRYVVTCNPSCSPVAGYRATLNATRSTLTIHSVGVADAGTWKIVDANVVGAIPVDMCQLTTIDSASTCPGGVALFGREYTIVGDRSKYTRFLWVRPTDGWYVATCNPSCSPVAGYRATMNATHSTLTIHSVGVADAGTWSIRDANDASAKPVDVCQLNATNSTCPGGVGLLGTEYTIVGDRSNYTGFKWVRPTDGRYVVTCNPSCSPVAGYRATLNATRSTLTIHSVGVADAGTWKIVDANVVGAIPVDLCQLTTIDSASTCPGGVALFGREYTIVGDRSKYTRFLWVRPTDGWYVATCNPSCSPVAGYRATMNATHSTLTIHSVGVADAGTWSIRDANDASAKPVDVCQLNATNSTCPGVVGLLGTEYTIVGDRSNYTGFLWVRPTDGRYVATCNPSCSPVAGYRATLNATHSTLTIHSVGVADAGTWKIVDANVVGAIPVDVCQLTTIGSTSSDTAITSSSSRLSSSTTPRSTTVVEGWVSPGAIAAIVIPIVIVLAIMVFLIILL